MKVVIVQAGLPHYFNLVLNRLNAHPDVEIVALVPSNPSSSIGSGVHQDRKGVDFRVEELPETKRFWTKPFFVGFDSFLEKEQPDAVIMGWPYMLGLVFDKQFQRTIERLKIKLIYKDIPFNIPPYNEVHQYFVNGKIKNESQTKNKSLVSYLKYRLLTYCRKLYLNKVDAHIYYTQAAVSLISTYGVEKNKIFITANSPDTDLLLNAYSEVKKLSEVLPENKQRIIHVGRLVQWKRVDLIIDAVNVLKNDFPNIELVVVGYGPEEGALKNQVKTLRLDKHVNFVGGIYNPVELGQYLYVSSIYVLAGMGGLSINDAMCFAKPIVCSVADGTEAALVKDGQNGFYFNEGDSLDLANKIRLILSDDARMVNFGQKSIDIIQNEVNIHTVISKYLEVFDYVKQLY